MQKKKPRKALNPDEQGYIFSTIFITIVLIVLPLLLVSQDDCALSTNTKANKLYEKGINRKKYSFSERKQFLAEALVADEDFTLARWKKAQMTIRDAILRNKTYFKMEKELRQVVDECPEIHSSPYYFLAEICMMNAEYADAERFYQEYISFDSDEEAKYSSKYDEYYETSKKNLEIASFLNKQYSNPKPMNPLVLDPPSTSEVEEYLPCLSPDNEVLYYTSRKTVKTTNRGSYIQTDEVSYIERFNASFANTGEYGPGKELDYPFNQIEELNYGGATMTADNREMILTICEPSKNMMACDLYYSRFEPTWSDVESRDILQWTYPEKMGSEINTEEGWEAQPTLSKDGKWLLFASLRDGSAGIDIFESRRNERGEWSKAKPLDLPINTTGNEKSPFFHSDSKTLYFASNGHLGLGGYDVFFAKLQDDHTWSEPINLGFPINSESDQHGYIVSLDGTKAYYSSRMNAEMKKMPTTDIYHFIMPEDVRPDRVILVKGKVENLEGFSPRKAVVEFRNTASREIEKFKVDSNDGTFAAIVNVADSGDLIMRIKGKEVSFNNQYIEINREERAMKIIKQVQVEKVKPGIHIKIENVHFKTNSAELSDVSRGQS